MKTNLNKIFSDFMETIYGELELDFNYDGTFTSDDLYNVKSVKDKEDDSFGYFQFDDYELTFCFYYECSKPKTIKGMFGPGWNKLLLKYLKKRFPEFDIVRVRW